MVLLIDTYDTEAAAEKVVKLAGQLRREGIVIKAVRLDSGDLAEHARRVRQMLDRAGLQEIRIFASGNLDEFSLEELVAAGAPIDGFGIGSRLITSADAPYLDCAYKLQEYAGRPRRKRSEGKATWPGRKQVYRRCGADGRMVEDLLTLEHEAQSGEALLQPVMRGGRRLTPPTPLAQLRAYAATQLARLPEPLRRLRGAPAYPVKITPALADLAHRVDQITG